MPLDAWEILDLALRQTQRRQRLCKQAPGCPKCDTRQVQLVDPRPLAAWKCRHCKFSWRFEPLVFKS